MVNEGLGQQHLAAAEHAAPAAVAAVGRAVKNRKLPTVGQPQTADEVRFEALKAFILANAQLE